MKYLKFLGALGLLFSMGNTLADTEYAYQNMELGNFKDELKLYNDVIFIDVAQKRIINGHSFIGYQDYSDSEEWSLCIVSPGGLTLSIPSNWNPSVKKTWQLIEEDGFIHDFTYRGEASLDVMGVKRKVLVVESLNYDFNEKLESGHIFYYSKKYGLLGYVVYGINQDGSRDSVIVYLSKDTYGYGHAQ